MFKALGIALPSAIYVLDMDDHSLRFVSGDASPDRVEWRKGAEEVGPTVGEKYFHPEDWPRAEAHWGDLAALEDGEICTISYRLLAHEGDYRRHVHREIVLSRDAMGKVKLVLGVSEDVSEHDRVEQELRDLSSRMLTAQIDERRRIAQELHDSTSQHLTAAALALTSARTINAGRHKRKANISLDEVIEDAARYLKEAQREIGVLSYLLHPPHLRSQGLAEALETFALGFGRRAGFKVEVDLSSRASEIDDDLAVQLFRVCQEALTNVFRHANARKAQVMLEVDHMIRLTIADDGRGLDATAPDTNLGMGLRGMRERMTRLGGSIHIDGGAAGTTVVATVPLATQTNS